VRRTNASHLRVRHLLGAASALALFPVLTARPASPASTGRAAPASRPRPEDHRGQFLTDKRGRAVRAAKNSPHITNYDEDKVGTYTLPDPLVMADGTPVTTPELWRKRRAEILDLYETRIFGRVPRNAPKVTWQVASTASALEGVEGKVQQLVGRMGEGPDAPAMHVTLMLPPGARGPVPVILCLHFPPPAPPAPPRPGSAAATRPAPVPPPFSGDPVPDMLARGWGYASVVYTDIQPDKANTFTQGVIGTTLRGAGVERGANKPAPDQWGAISAWAWGVSRIIDRFETDPAIDAKRIALMGHSRLGKTVLWAGALDPRIAVVYASCSGEMGAALSRRDYGETIDDMAETLSWQFAGNFLAYEGHWNDLPVDAHMLIALNAPHGVFITGGSRDEWADPKGEFLAEVAAGPVYQLLGKEDVGFSEMPAAEIALVAGDLGYLYHSGRHEATPGDWQAFLTFAGKYLRP
jgi:hypothetical protein